jgi:hypothetical protein
MAAIATLNGLTSHFQRLIIWSMSLLSLRLRRRVDFKVLTLAPYCPFDSELEFEVALGVWWGLVHLRLCFERDS